MTTLSEFMIIAGVDNRPPMLEKSIYDSWKSNIENKENERMILNSVQNGPLVWPTIVQEDGTTRTKKYEELSVTKKLQANCDLKATNIVLQGLPPNVYAIVNYHKVAKEIWDIVNILICERPVQVNTKFLNSLPLEWSKFVMDVKLARDLHTINYDQLYSYLEQHKAHANETRLMHERYQDPLAFVANFNQPPSCCSHVFTQGDDPIACLNKAMAFLSAIAVSRFPSTNNQLRTSSNPRNQATIQDGRVTVQQVHRRQGQSYAGTGY
ncbi:hypothetical protein Tco_1305011 [Tanacetum coccineum]